MTDPNFRLTSEERATLRPDLDLDALEDLLRELPPDVRPWLLRYARDWSSVDTEECLAAFPEIEPQGPVGRRTFIVPFIDDIEFDDPKLQHRLDQVLAPWRAGLRRRPPET